LVKKIKMIHIQKSINVTKIIVEEQLDKYTRDKLLQELDGKKLEILFINIKSLPLKLIKKLISMRDNLKIETTEKSLWQYLHKLGIIARYKNLIVAQTSKTRVDTKIIAFGGSAGSIERLNQIIPILPFVDITVFITIHIQPDNETLLPVLWQRLTNYTVVHGVDGLDIKPNYIYIAPPNYHMLVKNGKIQLSSSQKVCYSRPSIDVTFESLANEYKDELLVILLSGYGKDGTNSLKILKDNKSRVIIEDPNGCEAQDIPLNAIITKNYDQILSLKNIIKYISTLLKTNIDFRDELDNFCENIYDIYGYDFRNYDKGSLSRRIEYMMQNFNIDSFKKFAIMVLEDSEIFDKLLKEFSINVTSFFRNPQTYKSVRDVVLPQLASYPYIRIWCAGCSRGDEPYSIAIMLDEAGLLDKSQIYATDFNSTILTEAKNGLYDKDEYDKFKSNYKLSGGIKDFDSWFEVNDTYIEVKQRLKDNVLFFKHNLAIDRSINEFNLIFCRNVIIYFDTFLKKKVFSLFDKSLERNGFLVLGSSETHESCFDYKQIGNSKNKIYNKTLK